MNNKETLQNNNNRLAKNNLDLASVLETINNLPEADSGGSTQPKRLYLIKNGVEQTDVTGGSTFEYIPDSGDNMPGLKFNGDGYLGLCAKVWSFWRLTFNNIFDYQKYSHIYVEWAYPNASTPYAINQSQVALRTSKSDIKIFLTHLDGAKEKTTSGLDLSNATEEDQIRLIVGNIGDGDNYTDYPVQIYNLYLENPNASTQDKVVEITENGTQLITADEGYDSLNSVEVITNVVGSAEIPSIKDCRYLFDGGYRNNEIETLIACCTGATNMSNMFRLSNITAAITGFSNFKNNNVVSTEAMFMGVAVPSIDFTPNTLIRSNKTSSMFSGSSKLTKLDLSGFDFSAVTNTYGMFNNCKLLEELDISTFDFSKVTIFGTMFTNCGANLTDGKLTKVYVKDATAQSWILNSDNGKPSTWSTANVIIK